MSRVKGLLEHLSALLWSDREEWPIGLSPIFAVYDGVGNDSYRNQCRGSQGRDGFNQE
jgi:hypothetical protein